jgi:osmoprotectant transport system substrate-binding protein
MRRSLLLLIAGLLFLTAACRRRPQHVVVGSKFFTEQVVLTELLAQHIEAHTGVRVERRSNLGSTQICHQALLAGGIDVYVEYTGTALTAVLGENPSGDSRAVYERVRQAYADRFGLVVAEPLGYENTFALVVRAEDARRDHLRAISDIAPLAPRWRIGVGYEFLERPDGYRGWSERYGLRFAEPPRVMDLGLIYRALKEKLVDIIAGNSTDGLIDALGLVALEDDRHYFPPYDAVPIARREALEKFPKFRSALAGLAGKITAAEMRRLNYAVDGEHRDVADVVRSFRQSKGL